MLDMSEEEKRRRVEEAARNMPNLQRQIFMAHRLDDMPYEEIARRTGLSVRQVERHMARAIYKITMSLKGRKLRWWERWY
ncbi:MAG: sigma-70 family RNA polymerase sigma factor [Alphaproteobacteria bacterium]|nr:MAG: sigma-70 family RNA polymerase sigma factor [Alphaproteobacteria bacterium]